MITFVVLFVAVGAATGNPWLGVLAGAGGGVVAVWFHPYTSCWWCRGRRRYLDSWETSWRHCLVCRGRGERRRLLSYLIGGMP
jgi:hypothetical protein